MISIVVAGMNRRVWNSSYLVTRWLLYITN